MIVNLSSPWIHASGLGIKIKYVDGPWSMDMDMDMDHGHGHGIMDHTIGMIHEPMHLSE